MSITIRLIFFLCFWFLVYKLAVNILGFCLFLVSINGTINFKFLFISSLFKVCTLSYVYECGYL